MASAGDKGFKQDMVVSIRYRNDLPPPPMPPKFLDIDTGGIAQYLTTSYASSLARREEPNIEVDAEGGMPIDMIGIPGYFLGDESAIMASEIQPILDPADQALMLSVDQLKSQGAKNNVSFLRKTQYMTSQNARANDPFLTATPRSRKSIDGKAAPAAFAREDKENIKRHVQKGFDIAYPDSIPYNPPEAKGLPSTPAERDAWRNPTHPDNPRLKPVSYYPVLPDLDAVTDIVSGWYRVKFDKPPLAAIRNRRDERTDVALFMSSSNEAARPAWLAKKEAFEKNPQGYDDPGPEPYTWSMHIPKNPESVPRIRKILNDADPEKDDPALQEGLLEESTDGSMRIPFERARVYTSAIQANVDPQRFMAISLYDPETASNKSRLRKYGAAAYYYPILENDRFKADRGKLGKAATAAVDDIDPAASLADQVMVLPREPTAQEVLGRMQFRGECDSAYAGEYAEVQQAAEAAEAEEANKAEDAIAEQGSEDVTMEEAEDTEAADLKVNGVAKGRDDDRNTSTTDNASGRRNDDDDEMDDD